MNAANTNEEQRALPPEELRDRLLRNGNDLLVFPAVATEAIALTNDPDCSMAEFTCIVERDAKLATELLSLANSSLFTIGSPVTTIHQSLVRLGIRQCRNLILSACVAGMMKKISLEQEWIREVLWHHSFTTATACLHLNRAFGLGFQGEEFSAGLLHDFGRTLLATVCKDNFQVGDTLDFVENKKLLENETAILETNHCEFGAWFARHNQLPESLVEVIRWHHEPDRENEHQKLIALVAAGDHIANHIQRCGEAFGYEPDQNEAVKLLSELFHKNVDQNFSEIASQLVAGIYETALMNKSCCQGAV